MEYFEQQMDNHIQSCLNAQKEHEESRTTTFRNGLELGQLVYFDLQLHHITGFDADGRVNQISDGNCNTSGWFVIGDDLFLSTPEAKEISDRMMKAYAPVKAYSFANHADIRFYARDIWMKVMRDHDEGTRENLMIYFELQMSEIITMLSKIVKLQVGGVSIIHNPDF